MMNFKNWAHGFRAEVSHLVDSQAVLKILLGLRVVLIFRIVKKEDFGMIGFPP